jgi:hypothetical protein
LHEPDPTPDRPPLDDMQADRLDYARRDLENFRATDLTQLDAAGLILIVERMRGRLGDMLDLVDELRGDTQTS